MYTDSSLRHSHKRVADVLLPALATLNRSFRDRLEALDFSPAQRRVLEQVTSGAAAKAFRSGIALSTFLDSVRSAGEKLALLDVEPAQAVRAEREYEKLAGALYRKLPPAERTEAQSARSQLHSILVCVVNEAFTAVQTAENRLIHGLLRKEAASSDAAQLGNAVLSAAVRHFSANEGAVFAHTADECRLLCAVNGDAGKAQAAAASIGSDLAHIRHLSSK
jgi:hypothetical protein